VNERRCGKRKEYGEVLEYKKTNNEYEYDCLMSSYCIRLFLSQAIGAE
jgi:hypothetical protein